MHFNKVTSRDNRFMVWEEDNINEFLQIEKYAPWTASKSVYNELTSFDGGLTYSQNLGQVLFGTYFFLGNDFVQQSRIAFNIFDLLSKVGGLLTLFRIGF